MGSNNGYGFVPYKHYTPEQEARFKKLSKRTYIQAPNSGKNSKIDNHFVALPAGWRKSASGRWYFENRKNRSDNLNEKERAWNNGMSKEQKAQTFKHIHVDQTAVLNRNGQPEYVRYVVRYGNFLDTGEDKIKAARSFNSANRNRIIHGVRKAQTRVGGRKYSRSAYLNTMAQAGFGGYLDKPVAHALPSKKARAKKAAATKTARKSATIAKYRTALLSDMPVTTNKGRKPTAKKTTTRKSASKNAKLPTFAVAPTVKKATTKKVATKKTTTRKSTAKKSTARKTSKKN